MSHRKSSSWYKLFVLFLTLVTIVPMLFACGNNENDTTPTNAGGYTGTPGSTVTLEPSATATPPTTVTTAPSATATTTLPPTTVESPITKIDVTSRKVVYDGMAFGDSGTYEMLTGTAYGTLDSHSPLNTGIVNLNKAPTNANGLVEYSMDVQILKPTDLSKGNKRILYEVPNRGGTFDMSMFDDQTGFTQAGAGNGFLLKQGYTMVWSGWQGDIPASNPNNLGTTFPIAINSDGSAIVGMSREEYTDQYSSPFTATLSYPAATLDKTKATLTVRELEADKRIPVPAENWDYVDNTHIKVTQVAGFDKGAIYEFIYEAKDPIVMGIGFAATRDLVSFLRSSGRSDNPMAVGGTSTVQYTSAFGYSQAGRYLRDFLYQGFNQDTSGEKVFDGMLVLVAGARRTFTNYEFAQLGRFTRQHEDHMYPMDSFPFAYETTYDSLTNKTDGVLATCEKTNTAPKIFQIDSDSEFWQGHSSLLVTDTAGKPITNAAPNVRLFYLAGRCHFPGLSGKVLSQNSFSPAFLRPMLVSLDKWVSGQAEPLASKYPSVADGSLVTLDIAASQWPAGIPNWPWSDAINNIAVYDYSVLPPSVKSANYPLFVPRFNTDNGNTMDGLLYPDISVPIGTYSGRSPRAVGFAAGDLDGINGAYLQFESTRTARNSSGDPRPSIEDLYPGGDSDYQAKLKAAANVLVKEGYLLPEDATIYATKTLPAKAPPAPTPTAAPTTVAPTAAPTAAMHTGLDINSTMGELMGNENTKAVLVKCLGQDAVDQMQSYIGMIGSWDMARVKAASTSITDEMMKCLTDGLAAIK